MSDDTQPDFMFRLDDGARLSARVTFTKAQDALLAALTGTGEIRRQMDAAAVEICAECTAALTGAGGGR